MSCQSVTMSTTNINEDLLPELQTGMSKYSLGISTSAFHRQPKLISNLLPNSTLPGFPTSVLHNQPSPDANHQPSHPQILLSLLSQRSLKSTTSLHSRCHHSNLNRLDFCGSLQTAFPLTPRNPFSTEWTDSFFFFKNFQNSNSRQIYFKRQSRYCHNPPESLSVAY